MSKTCKKCGTSLDGMNLFCKDETCPYHDYLQAETLESIYGEAPLIGVRREPLMVVVTTDDGRATVEFDASAYLHWQIASGESSLWEEEYMRDADDALDKMVYACASDHARLNALVTYCESAMALDIEQCGFAVAFSDQDPLSYIRSVRASNA